MTEDYDPRNWFWVVGGDETRAWSSTSGDWVTVWPIERATRISNEVELFDVLVKVGLAAKAPQRTFTASEIRDALLAIDATATGGAVAANDLLNVAANMGVNLPDIS